MKPPPDAELIERAVALQETLEGLLPSADFSSGAIASLTEALDQIAAELRGEREPHITLFRPDSMTSYLRNNYESTLATPEGNDIYEFIRTLAHRAEALDLPRVAVRGDD